MKKFAHIGFALTLTLSSAAVLANDPHAGHGSHGAAPAPAAKAAAMSDGEVKKIDKEAGKITIKHGPLANLNMPPMTMVFKVKEPAMLNSVKVGDKIRFVAEQSGKTLQVARLESAK
ncbi:MAG TPA: copper-binding protein [Noviherbaspirillum sp.]